MSASSAPVNKPKTSWLDRSVLSAVNLDVEKTLYLIFIVAGDPHALLGAGRSRHEPRREPAHLLLVESLQGRRLLRTRP